MTLPAAFDMVRDPTIYGLMMVQAGDADGFVGGMYKAYSETIRPAIQIVGLKPGVSRVSAAHLLVLKDRIFFCADTMVNIEPTAEELAEIAGLAAELARTFDTDPQDRDAGLLELRIGAAPDFPEGGRRRRDRPQEVSRTGR